MPRNPVLLDRETLIARVRQAAEVQPEGRRLTRVEFERRTGTSAYQVIRQFGTFAALLEAAGCTPNRANARLSDDELLVTVRDACVKQRGVLPYMQFARLGLRSPNSYRRRWRNWPGVLKALREWCLLNDPGFAYLEDLPGPQGPGTMLEDGGRRYGAPLNYPGFLHEPVNEQGVILLFGALARPLGFAIEHVAGAFPDCEAKRRVGLDVWQRVRIEFEYQSRNFKVHGHDPQQCDLIVCWEDNWKEAPMQVLELKSEIPKVVASLTR